MYSDNMYKQLQDSYAHFWLISRHVIPKGVFFTNLRTQNPNNTSERKEKKKKNIRGEGVLERS